MKSLLFKKKAPASQLIQKPMPSLGLCLLMDILGCASYAVPLLGELIDVVWAPISAAIYLAMFGVKRGFFGGVFNFIEELVPGLDVIPTFTITWFLEYARRKKESNNTGVTTIIR